MEAPQILAYTLYLRNVSSANLPPVSCKGVYVTKCAAEKALVRCAEELCIAKMGSERFVKNQLSNPELSKDITDGFALRKVEHDEVEIEKRIPGTVWGCTPTVITYFGICPVFEDQEYQLHEITRADGSKESVSSQVTALSIVHAVKAPVKETRRKKKITFLPGASMTLTEKLNQELAVVVHKRQERLSQGKFYMTEIPVDIQEKKEQIIGQEVQIIEQEQKVQIIEQEQKEQIIEQEEQKVQIIEQVQEDNLLKDNVEESTDKSNDVIIDFTEINSNFDIETSQKLVKTVEDQLHKLMSQVQENIDEKMKSFEPFPSEDDLIEFDDVPVKEKSE